MTKTKEISSFFVVFCTVTLAFLALFAACERPEPEPEPPAPPVADTDTLPANKFIGTWVLCAMNNVNDGPPSTCDLANAMADTLVFVNDTMLTLYHGTKTFEYIYEFSEHFLVCYWPEAGDQTLKHSVRFYFREDGQELVLRGNFIPISALKNFCFRRFSQE